MGPLLLPALCGRGGCGLQAALSRPASPLCSRPACSTVGGGRPLPPAPPPLPAAAPDAAWMPRGCRVPARSSSSYPAVSSRLSHYFSCTEINSVPALPPWSPHLSWLVESVFSESFRKCLSDA